MSETINHDRRRFLGAALIGMAAAELVSIGSAGAQAGNINPADAGTIKPDAGSSFGSLKQIDAGVLNIGYAEAGSATGSSAAPGIICRRKRRRRLPKLSSKSTAIEMAIR
jgi:hypothetical protein